MFFFYEGKSAYLKFIQNLSSQIILLAAFYSVPKLSTFRSTEPIHLWIWASFGMMFLWAMIANIIEFLKAMEGKGVVAALIASLAVIVGVMLIFIVAPLVISLSPS